MATFQVHKVTAVPALPAVGNAIYVVAPPAQPNYVEFYMTSADGTAIKRVPTTTDIQAMIDASIGASGGLEVVADIAERDALTPAVNVMCLVLDASADATVAAGSATYAYRLSTTTWYKVAEYESMDLVIDWSMIQNKPTSTAAAIDAAVANSHTHANATQLGLIGEASGEMTYNGQNVRARLEAAGW